MTNTIAAPSKAALGARARRAAKRVGLVATRSRRRGAHNRGGFRLVQHCSLPGIVNVIIDGHSFDLTAEEIISFCEGLRLRPAGMSEEGRANV
jgi:hypothetical protein